MINGKTVVVVMPAFNAEKTLEDTYRDIPKEIVDEIILTDDFSHDKTVEIARRLGLKVFIHNQNKGYGANQKTCYQEALKLNAEIIIMLHPDYQYTPKLIPAMAYLIAVGQYDVVLASRILGNRALKGGMPLYKYISNRLLTFIENLLLNEKISEYHTGYRAFRREVLLNLPILANSDDFLFDNEILAQIIYFGYKIGEITCPAKYFPEASTIKLTRSIIYGLGVIGTALKFFLQKHGLKRYPIFERNNNQYLLMVDEAGISVKESKKEDEDIQAKQ